MLDNTIITKFELSEREKILKRQFFKREEEPGKKHLFYRPPEKINDSINKSNYSNNSQSFSLEQNQNTKLSNQLNINISNNDKFISNNFNVKQPQQNINQNLSNSIPDIKNITNEDMNKFYDAAANYLPKSNGMSPEQVNLLMHQNKIMQKNVDALQETNRSLQDFIIYSMKKDSMANKIPNENTKEKNNMEYEKLNKILTPLYNHINQLQSQVKELNQKKREDEINIEIDDLIIKNQKNFKPKHLPIATNKKPLKEDEKNNKMMMKTLSSLKGTVTNMTEQMKKIGNTFNEKMQKVLEDTEKNKLKSIVGGERSNSVINNKGGLGSKSILHNGISNNISLFKENGGNENESILKNKLDKIDYESFKADLIDIADIKDSIVNDYKSGALDFPKLTKPKTKIKFSYNLDNEFNSIMDKVNNRNKSKQDFKYNSKKSGKNQNLPMKEKVSKAINKDKMPQSSKIIMNKKNNNKDINNINNFNNKLNDIDYNKEDNEKENNMKKINELSVIDQMNLYKERMAQLSGNYEVKEKNEKNPNENQDNLNSSALNNVNNLGSNHSGVTFQNFNRPSSGNQIPNKNKYNPPKVRYGVFHGQKGIPNYNPNLNENEEPNIIMPKIVLPDQDKLNNVIKDTIDNYLAAAFMNLKPSEAPKIPNIKNPPQNVTERVIEREIIIKPNKNEQNMPQPQPIVINPVSQQDIGQNKEIMEKFLHLSEKLTNLEEKITNKIVEEKHIEKEIKIIEKKEKEPQYYKQGNNAPVVNTDLISKLVYDKIKKHLNIDINEGKKQNIEPPQQPQTKAKYEPKEEKEEENIDIFDVNNNINIDELEEKITMPHKINLAEYEVSQTSSYLSESLQKNNFNLNNSNQINYNRINVNINENSNNEINMNQGNINNSKSEGETSNNENTSNNDNNNINNNIMNQRNRGGIDLLHLKNLNEEFQNNINILQDNNNIVNIPQIGQDNNYYEYLNYINNNINNNNIPPKSLNPFDNENININSKDNFFNDSD